MSKEWIKIEKVKKYYSTEKVWALRNASLTIDKGEFVAIRGASGSGKSTLLHLIGGLERPTDGKITVGDLEVSHSTKLDHYRRNTIGFIFQLHNLLPHLSVLDNLLIPTIGTRAPHKQLVDHAKNLLKLVKLEDKVNQKPINLSGGERQRVAFARAFMNNPELIIADEPTGSLDSKTSDEVMKMLKNIWKDKGVTILLVTHDEESAEYATRTIPIKDGKIKS